MKIAVASTGDKEDSLVSDVGGRAPFYLIFEDGKLVKSIKNPFRAGGGGAGTGVAQMLANEGAEMVICGHIGPRMREWLDSKGIKMMEVETKTKVSEVIKEVVE